MVSLRSTLLLAGAALLLLVSSCKRGDDDKSPTSTETPAAAEPSTSQLTPDQSGKKGETSKPAPALELIAKTEVKALIESWLAAQNKGDFATYEGLYASRLTGIKRVGTRTFKFDRAGWIKDRKRMFKRPMKVSADDLAIRASSQSAIAQITQTWASGKFKDVGPKQLVVVREKNGLRIAREEMLQSTIVDETAGGAAGNGAGVLLTREIDGIDYLVLGTDTSEVDEAGPLEMIEPGDPYIVRRKVDKSELPPELAELEKNGVTVFSASGESCKAKLGDLYVTVGVFPHFGTVQHWDDTFEERGEKSTPAEIANEVWSMASGRQVYAEWEGDCDGDWGVAGDASKATVLERVEDKALSDKAIAHFRKLDAYQEIQEDYEVESNDKTPWAIPSVRIFRDTKNQRHFIALAAQEGEGCGRWEGALAALFEVDSKGRFETVSSAHSYPETFMPTAAFDSNGDGYIELIDEHRLVRYLEDGYAETRNIEWDNYDCPC